MRIGLVRRGYSGSGGAERYLIRLSDALAGAGHGTSLYASPEWPEGMGSFPGGIHRIPGSSPRQFADAFQKGRPSVPGETIFSLERLHECDTYRAGDGVHLAWMQRRAPHEPKFRAWFRALQGKHREILELEESMFRRQGAGHVVANSRMVRDELISFYGYPAERISVVYNGVPRVAFEPSGETRERTREKLGLSPGTLLLLFLGSGWERKGLRFAAEAVRCLPQSVDCSLVVAGKDRTPIPANPRIKLIGTVPDPRPLLEAADLFILPTLYDPFSNATLEAAAAGLPVITSSANGFSEIMTEGIHGSVVNNPADPGTLQETITSWLDPEKRRAASGAIRQLASAYTMDANLAGTLKALGA